MSPEDTKKKLQRTIALDVTLNDIKDEVARAVAKYPPMNSAHEAWAVLFEEVDELWEEVRAKQGERDLDAMRAECIQVAAMAVRFAMDICTPEKVQK
jgi:NTP pyrophosphatase (non-canonical NTP hydrolase)